MNNLPNYAIPFMSVATPKSEFVPEIGTARWSEDGRRLLEYDWEDVCNVYLGHRFEMEPVYSDDMDGEDAGKPTGEMKEVCYAMMLTLTAPVTREKIFNAAINEIYVLNGLQQQLEFTQKMLNGTIEDNDSEELKMYKEIANWVNWEIQIWAGLTLDEAKAKMIAEIDAYDTSDNVNSFFLQLGDQKFQWWIDRNTRISLSRSVQIEKEAQEAMKVPEPRTTIWYNSIELNLSCDAVQSMLNALELYALACYGNTASHVSTVEKMNSIEDVLSYDYTTGYPEKLTFNIG